MSGFPSLFRAVIGQRSGAVGVALVGLHLLILLIAPLIVPYDFAAQDSGAMFTGVASENGK